MSLVSWAIDQAYLQRGIRQIRSEHDEWMRGAQLGVRYYTVRPIHPKRADMPWTVNEHSSYVFVKNGAFGLPGQLITREGTPSWRIWQQHGPLTLAAKPLGHPVANNGPADNRGRAVAAAVHSGYLDELERLYPASVNAVLAGV